MIAWVFPGQGSQFAGMAADLTVGPARAVWHTAAEILGRDLRSICLNGPKEALDATETAQPAILTASVAAARTMEDVGLRPDLVAGHSVGELAALVVARALTFEDALRVAIVRANAMAAAGVAREGGMAAVIGLSAADTERALASVSGEVVVANVNAPGQVVISGERAAMAAAADAVRAAGARRVIPLAVSVAAHSPLMRSAADALARALSETPIVAPAVPIASCIDGSFLEQPGDVSRDLVIGMTSRVDWPRCVEALHSAGARSFVEVGPGRVLTGLGKRILPDVHAASVEGRGEAMALAQELATGAVR
ncbi:MAG: ACP S-malonyltransferase [Actinomycetota bacterium]